jgi:hypothetical protein
VRPAHWNRLPKKQPRRSKVLAGLCGP